MFAVRRAIKAHPLLNSHLEALLAECLAQPGTILFHESRFLNFFHTEARSLRAWRPPASLPPPLSRHRGLASAASEAEGTQEEHDLLQSKFVRLFAAVFLAGAAIRVIPYAAVGAVEHSVKLMDAEESMLVNAGLGRIHRLVGMEAAKTKAVECGVVGRLVPLVQKEGSTEVSCRAVEVLDAVCDLPQGLAAARETGGVGALEAFLQATERSPATEDALHAAKRVLKMLKASELT